MNVDQPERPKKKHGSVAAPPATRPAVGAAIMPAVPLGRAGRTGSDNVYDVDDRAFMPPIV